ncbi:hypothetical protein Leryth_023654 [Lithospermum erythrorhizon]|uniref:Uncharacterized protein n=1 Tax=Lithospermum erythrorhizon TaxID=34254 RepID=A0AAV3P6S8_LITER|nr:hypothetical protein Leryth_023654 [Lithospermum erythrorhizon]
MANRTPNTGFNAAHSPSPGQGQLRREDLANQPSDVHTNQNQGFLQDTGTQMGNMVQGAADIGKGAAATVVSVARGTALGAANIAEGAAHAVKNTIGTENPNATSNPSNYSKRV